MSIDRGGDSFCGRMKEGTPLGEVREETIDGRLVVARRSRKILQHHRSGSQRQPDPSAPCAIDSFIKESFKFIGDRGISNEVCDKCRRRIDIWVYKGGQINHRYDKKWQ